ICNCHYRIMLLLYKLKAGLILLPGTTSIQVGETVTLTCSVEGSSGWTYYLFRQNYGALKTSESSGSFRISKGVSNRVTVNVDTRWSQFFYGETVTVRCDIQGGGDADWVYEWRTPQRTWTSTSKDKYWTVSAFPGDYMCQARSKSDWYSSTNWSENLKMMVSAKPTAQLSTETNEIPAGGSVTLSCSVKSSFGWIYYWYRDGSSEPLNTQDADFQTAGSIRVSKGGVYWCRGGRGDPVYYTEYSHSLLGPLVSAISSVVLCVDGEPRGNIKPGFDCCLSFGNSDCVPRGTPHNH
uniref:Ig-like domain-containing protein n=1 Tax=Echeneis naucrates TaxID=173247 RepID=A0A665WVR6_ECHNA